MLLLPETQTGEAKGLSKKELFFGNWGALDRKSLSLFLVFIGFNVTSYKCVMAMLSSEKVF
jgi:hypothetical protein